MTENNRIEFTFNELGALAALLAALNANGVPYSLRKDNVAIEVTISRGF